PRWRPSAPKTKNSYVVAPVDRDDDAPGVGSLVVEWEPPSGGGSAVYAYQVRHRRGDYDYSTGGGEWTEGPEIYPRQTWRICRKSSVDGCENPRSYAITGLIAGRKHDVAVRAKNANGWGDWRWIGHFNIPNGLPPLLQDATVNGSTLTLTFDQTLDSGSNPGASPFTVTVAGSDRSVAAVGISGSTVTLTLGTAVTSGQTVTVSYARPEERPLQHEGAQGPSFSDESVTNDTP
ncbi:MAG: SwmB domain-containing protein, partial [Chloroflexota bacterium]|nr:SwmB domain-containing protein [Chloroflexota bacterium]